MYVIIRPTLIPSPGKSTTLRLACVATIMAQLGGYVPAARCEMTPVDRIFTRIGAHDRILQGQSTFYVELEETATILRASTAASLVILDELGRGTSTFDGTAIAYAVIQHLKAELQCRCLFSTHYAMLTEEFAGDARVANYHMAYAVNQQREEVTFLYRFVQGTCAKSHGMNVARLAGLPEALVARAALMSDKFEASLRAAHKYAALLGADASSSAGSASASAAAAVSEADAKLMGDVMRQLKAGNADELRALLRAHASA
jgi:DNA mismatch repair protein MSH6